MNIYMKEYQLNVDPRILELLGPNLYTNIYYVLAANLLLMRMMQMHIMYISFLIKTISESRMMGMVCLIRMEK